MQTEKSASKNDSEKVKAKKRNHSIVLMSSPLEGFKVNMGEKFSELMARALAYINKERSRRSQGQISLKDLSIMVDGDMKKDIGEDLKDDFVINKALSISLMFKVTGGF